MIEKCYMTKSGRAIVRYLYNNKMATRVELSQKLNITKANVTILITKMLEDKLVFEYDNTEKVCRVGPKDKIIKLNENRFYILGIAFEKDSLLVGISNLINEGVENFEVQYNNTDDKIDKVVSLSNELIKKYSIENIIGCGVSIIGEVEPISGIARNSLGIFPKDFALKEEIEKRLKIDVFLQNNVKALSLAEYMYYNKKEILQDFLFVKIGPGLGSSLIIDGKLLEGAKHTAGEIGKFRAEIGDKKCLEDIVNENNMLKIGGYESAVNMYKNMSSKEVTAEFTGVFDYLALAIMNLYELFGSLNIVLYGKFTQNETIKNIVINGIRKNMTNEEILKNLKISNLSSDLTYLGGTSLVIKNTF